MIWLVLDSYGVRMPNSEKIISLKNLINIAKKYKSSKDIDIRDLAEYCFIQATKELKNA